MNTSKTDDQKTNKTPSSPSSSAPAPIQSGSAPTQSPPAAPSVSQQEVESPPPVPSVPDMPSDGKIVVSPAKSESLPLWFYVLFAVVAVVFFSITILLVQTIVKRQQANPASTNVTASQPTEAVTPVSPTQAGPSPTPQDEYLNKAGNTQESDEVSLIEADLESTDIKTLTDDLANFQE